MRCKCCDCMLKDNHPIFRSVEVDGEMVRVVEDLCPTCRYHSEVEEELPELDELKRIVESVIRQERWDD